MRKLSIPYSIAIIIISLFFLFIEFYPNARPYIIENIFSLDKSLTKIDAKVIGYSYDIEKTGTKGGYYYNYLYGIRYEINNQTYFARVIVAEHKSKEYDKYLPLSKTISILVNKNKSEIFLFPYKNNGSNGFFLDILCLFIGVILLISSKDSKWSDIIPKIRKDNKIGGVLIFICLIIFLSYPFYRFYSFYNSSKNGLVSENITNYTLVFKKPVLQNEIEKSKHYHSDPYNIYFHRNLTVYSDNRVSLFNIATLENFSDKNITKCTLLDRESNKKEIDFKFNKNDLEIIMQEDIDIKKPNFNIYIYSTTNQYFLPLDIIK